MIGISNLTVRFGGVLSLAGVTVDFPGGACGLIGPNGAGKTTFFNVLSGFVVPVEGSVDVDGVDLLAMPDFKRARWGVRRTFQTEQAIEALTVFDNVRTVLEHTREHTREHGKDSARTQVLDAVEFCGLGAQAHSRVGTLSPRERRLVEVARAVVGSPKLILLDEPGAGLPEAESEHLGTVIRQIPDHVGATVILVEHDMSLVRKCCDWTAVLDFGRLLSCGPTEDVLRDPTVLAAYLGQEVEA